MTIWVCKFSAFSNQEDQERVYEEASKSRLRIERGSTGYLRAFEG